MNVSGQTQPLLVIIIFVVVGAILVALVVFTPIGESILEAISPATATLEVVPGTPTATLGPTPTYTRIPTRTPTVTPTPTMTLTLTATPVPWIEIRGEVFYEACQLLVDLNPDMVCPIVAVADVPQVDALFVDDEGNPTGYGLYLEEGKDYFCGQPGHPCVADNASLIVFRVGTFWVGSSIYAELMEMYPLLALGNGFELTVMRGDSLLYAPDYREDYGFEIVLTIPLPERYMYALRVLTYVLEIGERLPLEERPGYLSPTPLP